MGKLLKKWFPTGSLGCFFCGVDSTPLLVVFIGIIGGLALATVFTFVGLWMRGRWDDPEKTKFEVFEAERRV